jgi:Tfp pilus assembly protein PilE
MPQSILQIQHGAARKPDRSVSLVLAIVLACVLTTILLPRYRDYTLREHRKLAQLMMVDAMQRSRAWEKNHSGKRLLSMDNLGYVAAAMYVSADGTAGGRINLSSVYRMNLTFPTERSQESCGQVVDPSDGGFVLVAEPIQTQRVDTQCATLCLTSSGARLSSGTEGSDQCWSMR